MQRTQFLHIRALGLACLAFLAVAGVAGAASRPLDLDQDGLSDADERALGTSAQRADSDGDGLSDGWEAARGLDALAADSDEDGLADDREIAIHSDPLARDSDGDGLRDSSEAVRADGGPDCDADGLPAVRQTDDDGDGRRDADEAADERCSPDFDADGVMDGYEGGVQCVTNPDCDGDGVGDGEEVAAGFNPLDPDTFDVHLPDGVVFAFQKSGQAPSNDTDADGIPDSWENQSGLIDWGAFQPSPGQRDLLVEFVRVLGPDSSRFSSVSLRPAYDRVVDAFGQNGITLQYVEKVVTFDAEPLAAYEPSRTSDYYRTVLDKATYSANPYVLTVVLNPQHNQTGLLHSGVAPLRGMLAAVDVSQFVEFTLHDANGDYNIPQVLVFYESLITAGRISETKLTGGVAEDGRYYLVVAGAGGGRELRWTPYWFRAPQIEGDGGEWVDLLISDRNLQPSELAHTILHEIGHTLGLCHAHESACRAQLPPEDRNRAEESSMSYTSPDDLVAFLPSEWAKVQSYMACPPPTPVRLLAEGASLDERLDAKYAYELDPDPAVAGRNCADYAALPHDLDPDLAPTRYDPPAGRAVAPGRPQNNPAPTFAYWAGVTGLGAFLALTVGRWRLHADLAGSQAAARP